MVPKPLVSTQTGVARVFLRVAKLIIKPHVHGKKKNLLSCLFILSENHCVCNECAVKLCKMVNEFIMKIIDD